MTPSSEQNPSSLDPEILRELEAAEAGLPSALLNDSPLLDLDLLGDDTPLVTADPEGGMLRPAPGRRPVTSRPRYTEPPAATPDPSAIAPAPEPLPPVGESPAPPAAGVAMDWSAEEAPLSQAMLDALVAEEAARRHAQELDDEPSPANRSAVEPHSSHAGSGLGIDLNNGWTEALLSQDDLDRMLDAQSAPQDPALADSLWDDGAGRENHSAEDEVVASSDDGGDNANSNTSSDDGLLSQDALDALIAGEDAPTASQSEEIDGPLSQDDLDALIAEEDAAPEATDTDNDGLLSQDDLDALIAGEVAAPEATTTDNDGPLSQDDLDALIAGEIDAPEATTTDNDGPLSQDDLDALIAGEVGTPKATTADNDGPLSQDDLDALIAGEIDAPEATTTDNDGPLSQDDLDALIAGASAEQDASETADDGALSQADLDALLAGIEGGTPIDASPGSDTLSQEDLDALLAAATGAPVPEPPPKKKASEIASGKIDQRTIDALLNAVPEESDDVDDDAAVSLTDADLEGLFDRSSAKDEDGPLDQSNVDALLADSGEEQILGGEQLDAPVLDSGSAHDDVSLTRSSIDALMADLDAAATSDGGEDALSRISEDDEDEIGEVSQDMIDALIASAQAEAPGARSAASESEVGSENLAAAATASDPGPDLLSQSDLDKLIEESRKQDKERNKAKQRALEDAITSAQQAARGASAEPKPADAAKRVPRFRKPGVLGPFVREHFTRLAASILVGFISAAAVGTTLYLNREQVHYGPSSESVMELELALERAQEEMARGDYVAAIETLEEPVRRALPSTARSDAQYLLLEARYRSFRGEPGSDPFVELAARIDELVAQAPSHPRAPEALYWKAQHFASSLPQTALEVYASLFQDYATAPGMDQMLLDAAQLALAQNDPRQAAIYAQDLLSRFPGSSLSGEAILVMGDANVIAGNTQDARAMFVRMADAEPDSRLGAEAYLRLGKLAYDAGQYDQAIMQLSRRLETTTTTQGNDEVYLLLAQAYRQAGQLNEARDTLNDLLNVFEPSAVTPQAFIEYSQVFEALGEREKAVKTAERAALEYPGDPAVLRNHGEFQGLNGNPLSAAIALVAAEKAGAADPNLLLTAARYYRTANMPREAASTYARLKALYGGTPASLAGGVEAAELRYAQGQVEGALDDLKSLQAATRGTEHYLPAVRSMLGIYKDLGLSDHVRNLAGEVAQLSEEPEVLAQAALDLMNTGDLERAQNTLERVELARLKTGTAFQVLMKEGESLIAVAPQRGLEKMEEAYFNYPEARTPESDQKLLETYLQTGRAAAARRMVMDLKASTDQAPMKAPYLVDAAVAWGDYLYDREDYRTAVFAYSLAEEAGVRAGEPVAGLRSHPDWARYQRANALLRLADYAGCLPLFEQIAASDSVWAGEAAVKADIARLEQRQRGLSVASAQAG